MAGPRATGSVEMAKLARDLHRMGAAGRKRLKRAMEQAGQAALSDARSRASWSSRIPSAISLRPEVRGDRFGVSLRVSASAAPHGRPFEGLGGGGQFRHPVFGDRETWVPQATRPYVWPAVRGRAPQVTAALGTAYEEAAREAGFR